MFQICALEFEALFLLRRDFMKIYKQLFLFFLPILKGTIVQQLYSTVDTMIVGQFVGKLALASIVVLLLLLQKSLLPFLMGLSVVLRLSLPKLLVKIIQ